MSHYLRTDQYTNVTSECPVNVDLHRQDQVVEIIVGAHRIDGDTLRLVFDNPDTCQRLAEALHNARDQLAALTPR